jgi:hypothetical protein
VANNMGNNANSQGLDSDLLAWSAVRAARWPHLFSNVLDRYLDLNDLSNADLCSLLHCDPTTLNHLRLCGRPDPDPSEFAIDIQRVADKLGLDAGTLASIVREVDAAEAFSQAGRSPSIRTGHGQAIPPFSSTPGMLKAARDHEEPQGVEDQTEDQNESPTDGQNGGEPGTGS